MKLFELTNYSKYGATREQHLQKLKELVDAGKQPHVRDASFVRDEFSMGDLQALGYAEYKKEGGGSIGKGDVLTYWMYTGPRSIVVDGKVLRKGDTTEPVAVDYS